MNVFHTRIDMERQLTDAFKTRYRRKDVVLTGILLARPEDKVTREFILPNLQYWHYRSDNYTDFFCAGYVPVDFVSKADPVDVEIDGLKWGFDQKAFVELVNGIENDTGWHYTGGPCLLLLNAYFDGMTARFDLFRAMNINLLEALDNKAIANPTHLADIVFNIAKEMNDSVLDPVWEVSNKFGRRVIKRGLKDMFLGRLPSWLSSAAKDGVQFVVHELRPKDDEPFS
jgi:hypothetical protein